jgi:hypothetical protein
MATEHLIRAADDYNRFAERSGAPSRCDPSLSFEAPELVQVASLWRDKSAERSLPLRRDMNARALKAYLPHIIIADVVRDEERRRYLFRLMGTSIARVFGDHTGRFLDEAIVSPYCERWIAALDTALTAGGPVRLSGRVEHRQQDYLAMEIFLAPIEQRGESAEAVLVAAYAKFSARHIFEPLVRNKISASAAVAADSADQTVSAG